MPYLAAVLERPCQARAEGEQCPLLSSSTPILPKHLANNAGSAAVEAQAATKAAAEAGLLHGGAPEAWRALRREATHAPAVSEGHCIGNEGAGKGLECWLREESFLAAMGRFEAQAARSKAYSSSRCRSP